MLKSDYVFEPLFFKELTSDRPTFSFLALHKTERFNDLSVRSFDVRYNPLLDELKKKFSVYDFVPDLLRTEKKFSDTEADQIIRENINVAIDFYRRFVKRIRLMMEHSTDYDLISFMGP